MIASIGGAPNRWLAALLGLLFPSLGMLYVTQPFWAALYFVTLFGAVVASFAGYANLALPTFVPAVAAVVASVHAYWLARYFVVTRQRPWYSRWYGLLFFVLLLLALIFSSRSFLFEPFRSPAGSMLPTIKPGSILITEKWGFGHYGTFGLQLMKVGISREIRRADMLVFEYPPDRTFTYIKRVIGLPGDRVSYLDHRLRINDRDVPTTPNGEYFSKSKPSPALLFTEKLGESLYSILLDPTDPPPTPFLHAFAHWEKCSNTGKGIICHVPAGHYFVMGDNRDNSADSRLWGFVPEDHVIGRVIRVVE